MTCNLGPTVWAFVLVWRKPLVKKVKPPPELIRVREMARLMGIQTETLTQWIERRIWPPPHSEFERTKFYRVKHFRAYIDTGHWPTDAWPRGSWKQ